MSKQLSLREQLKEAKPGTRFDIEVWPGTEHRFCGVWVKLDPISDPPTFLDLWAHTRTGEICHYSVLLDCIEGEFVD